MSVLGTSSLASAAGGGSASVAADPPVLFGAHVDGMTDEATRVDDFEQLVGHRADIVSTYTGYGAVFPGPLEMRLSDGGHRKVLVAWDPGETRYAEWAGGAHDAYLAKLVAAANDFPYRIYVRPWAEMNGDWSTFQPTPLGAKPNGGTYREFRLAWRHMVSYFRKHGATNVKWVFNPDAATYPGTTPVEKIWPGERYVDVLGIDGFNWGADDQWGEWRSYREIFTPMYTQLTALDSAAPVWICEFGSKEPLVDDGAPIDARQSKATWLANALRYDGFPAVEALIYFQANKERNWLLDSSPGSLEAARAALDGARFSAPPPS